VEAPLPRTQAAVERFNEFAVQNEMSANGQERTLKPRLLSNENPGHRPGQAFGERNLLIETQVLRLPHCTTPISTR
jgi:hypothetical protein